VKSKTDGENHKFITNVIYGVPGIGVAIGYTLLLLVAAATPARRRSLADTSYFKVSEKNESVA
jgi:hypothetical protein